MITGYERYLLFFILNEKKTNKHMCTTFYRDEPTLFNLHIEGIEKKDLNKNLLCECGLEDCASIGKSLWLHKHPSILINPYSFLKQTIIKRLVEVESSMPDFLFSIALESLK